MRRYSEAVKADVRRRMRPPMRQSGVVAEAAADQSLRLKSANPPEKAKQAAS